MALREEASAWCSYYAGGALVDPAVAAATAALAAAARDGAMARRDATAAKTAASGGVSVPRLALCDIERRADALLRYMEVHGYLVLTDIGVTHEALYAAMERELDAFFDGDGEEGDEVAAAAAQAERANSTGPALYKNEKGVPMWHCGYEHEQMRDAFRFPAGHCAAEQRWPGAGFKMAWLALMEALQRICDRCLAVVDAVPVQQLLPGSGERPSFYLKRSAGSGQPSGQQHYYRRYRRPTGVDEDKSVSYAVRYPNNRGGQQAQGINIKEHKDPSLFVIEPVARVQGLEVWDRAARRWVEAEAVCEAGREFVLFGGKALERVTNGRIPAAPHRVTHAKEKRTVFIFEQKYAEFFDDPAFDF